MVKSITPMILETIKFNEEGVFYERFNTQKTQEI